MTYPQTPGFKENGTSREAAVAISSSASVLRAQVLEYITANPSKTADEIAAALQRRKSAIRPRVSELRRDGLVEKDGRGLNDSGMTAYRWKAASAA